ncbi:hypothetical protein Ahy_A07g031869 isoform A [Arachis hypogaea]|uniref:DUF4283 domain-containing protein n=1 Tax=Arachis hypogaea TaxID=3818 RepID=A0A445C5D9_ARAHY|nr:hypothetical protein Ahy_A07g031869 isoform A [Arachis hypogaea]
METAIYTTGSKYPKVEKALDTMLKVDELTSIHSRGKFARICVKIDLNKKLIPYILALGKDFKLEYEGLHQICFKCERKWKGEMEQEHNFGVESSKEGNQEIDGSNQDPKDKKGNNLFPKEKNPFGPWMLVKRNQRRYKPKMENSYMKKRKDFSQADFKF